MSKILITGSADGLGALAAQDLIKKGHQVYLHARTTSRATDAQKNSPGAQACLVADLSSLSEVKNLAKEINSLAPWDAIIHSAGVMHGVGGKKAKDGGDYGLLFATNTLAPYVLTSLVGGNSKRYVFLGSQLHQSGDGSLSDVRNCGYGDSKLHDVMLAFAFSKLLKGKGAEEVNALDPGWVPTKMGGAGATDDIEASVQTYVKLAEGAGTTGEYWGPGAQRGRRFQSAAGDEAVQSKLLKELEQISGVNMPS